MPDKVVEQLFLPVSWEESRPEFIRKQFELARSVNPLIDGRIYQARTLTAAATMNAADGVILADASAAAFTISAIAADEAINKVIRVKKIDAGVNKVFVKAAGSDTIQGVGTFTLAAQYDALVMYSSGAGTWWRF